MSLVEKIAEATAKVAEEVVMAYVTDSTLGEEEKAVVAAVIAVWKNPSVDSVVTAIEDAMKVVTDLKAPKQPEVETQPQQ